MQWRDLQSEDRLIIPIIQDVIVQMQKAKKPPTQVKIVAKKQLVPLTVSEDSNPPSLSTEETCEKAIKLEKSVFHVHVANMSKYVPVEAIKEAVKALVPTKGISDKSDECICQVQEAYNAIRLVITLSNYRLPDTKLKVFAEEPLDFKNASVKPAEESSERINIVFKRFHDDIVDNLREAYTKDINYYTYKTQVCKYIKCRYQSLCHNYHNIMDCRRSPLTTLYSSSPCEYAERGECQKRKECMLSHTLVERKFHLVTFRENLCIDAVKRGTCRVRNGVCADVHPGKHCFIFWRLTLTQTMC